MIYSALNYLPTQNIILIDLQSIARFVVQIWYKFLCQIESRSDIFTFPSRETISGSDIRPSCNSRPDLSQIVKESFESQKVANAHSNLPDFL